VQFVLVTTAILMLVPLTWRAAGGWQRFVSTVPAGFFHPVNGPYTWGYLGAFVVLTTLSLAGNWSLIQKFYSARNEKECRGVGWLASGLFFLVPPAWIFTGMLARAFIPPGGFDPQTIYARVSAALLPAGMLGLVIAALFASTMSVLSSGYNVIAAVLTVDVHQRWIHPGATQRELVIVGRALTAVVATVALSIALAVTYFHWAIFDTMVAAFGFFLPPTVLPVLAGLLSRRLSARGALAGFFTGIGTASGFWAYKLVAKPANFIAFQAVSIVIPALVTALVLSGAAFWFPATGEAAERSSRFFARLSQPAGPAAEGGESPAPIAGLVILAMGLILGIVGSGVLGAVANMLTLGTGLFLTLIGGSMVGSRFWPRRLPIHD
jgi:Na+/proline symporter